MPYETKYFRASHKCADLTPKCGGGTGLKSRISPCGLLEIEKKKKIIHEETPKNFVGAIEASDKEEIHFSRDRDKPEVTIARIPETSPRLAFFISRRQILSPLYSDFLLLLVRQSTQGIQPEF